MKKTLQVNKEVLAQIDVDKSENSGFKVVLGTTSADTPAPVNDAVLPAEKTTDVSVDGKDFEQEQPVVTAPIEPKYDSDNIVLTDDPNQWFELHEDGVFLKTIHKVSGKDSSKKEYVESRKICDWLRVSHYSLTYNRKLFGKVVEWKDSLGTIRNLTVMESDVQNNFKKIRSALADGGLKHMVLTKGTNSKDPLQMYIHYAEPSEQAFTTEKLGWHRSPDGKLCFVLPGGTIGANASPVILSTGSKSNLNWIGQSGNLKTWQDKVAKPATASNRMVFAISVVFAAPLLGIVNLAESRLFHFSGKSSTGKTKSLRIAQSVIGYRESLPSWRSTSVGLERTALAHNSVTMFLDELGAIDNTKSFLSDIYLICNGSTKSRSDIDLSCPTIENWLLLGLVSGEVDLHQLAADTKERVKAGQELRFVNIPVDVDNPLGVFESIPPGFKTVKEFLDKADAVIKDHFGVAFDAWIRYLVELRTTNDNALKRHLQKEIEKFLAMALEEDDTDQVRRVCTTFAIVAAAGNLASGGASTLKVRTQNVTGWRCNKTKSKGTAWNAALACFVAWKRALGTSNTAIEDQEIIDNAKLILETQKSRFLPSASKKDPPPNMIGWTCKGTYRIPEESYKANFCVGRNKRLVDKVLKKAGILIGATSSEPKAMGKVWTRVLVYPDMDVTDSENNDEE